MVASPAGANARRSSSRPRNQVSWPIVRSVEPLRHVQIAAAATIVAALAMVAARTEPHVGAPNWRPPYRTYWYDPWPLLTGQKSTTLRFCGVSAPFAHPTTTLHHPPGEPTNPPSARFTRTKRECHIGDPSSRHENPSNELSHGPGGPHTACFLFLVGRSQTTAYARFSAAL